MSWSDTLKDWQNGIVPTYPRHIQDRFQWNTSVLKNDGNVPFKQSFKVDHRLPHRQDTRPYREYIKQSKNEYVISFVNLSNDAVLVVPMPVGKRNYATLKDFMDNAPQIQQQRFWKTVSKIARKLMKEKGKVWISTHGFGVAYTHVRVSISPKYYFDKELAIG